MNILKGPEFQATILREKFQIPLKPLDKSIGTLPNGAEGFLVMPLIKHIIPSSQDPYAYAVDFILEKLPCKKELLPHFSIKQHSRTFEFWERFDPSKTPIIPIQFKVRYKSTLTLLKEKSAHELFLGVFQVGIALLVHQDNSSQFPLLDYIDKAFEDYDPDMINLLDPVINCAGDFFYKGFTPYFFRSIKDNSLNLSHMELGCIGFWKTPTTFK